MSNENKPMKRPLTYYEWKTIKRMGYLWEFYPEATGDWNKDNGLLMIDAPPPEEAHLISEAETEPDEWLSHDVRDNADQQEYVYPEYDIYRHLESAIKYKYGTPAQFARRVRQEEAENAQTRLDELACEMVYNGNSVSYIYSKLENYKAVIGEACALFRGRMDGNTSFIEFIKEDQQQLMEQRDRIDSLESSLAAARVELGEYIQYLGIAERERDAAKEEVEAKDLQLKEEIKLHKIKCGRIVDLENQLAAAMEEIAELKHDKEQCANKIRTVLRHDMHLSIPATSELHDMLQILTGEAMEESK